MIVVSYKNIFSQPKRVEFSGDKLGEFFATEYKNELEKQFPFISCVKIEKTEDIE